MRLALSALECDIDTSLALPSNAAGIYIKKSLNVLCVLTLYISNKGHKRNKRERIPPILDAETIQVSSLTFKKCADCFTCSRIIILQPRSSAP